MYRDRHQVRSNYLFILALVPLRTLSCSNICLENILSIEWLSTAPLCALLSQASAENNHAAHDAGWCKETSTRGFPTSNPPGVFCFTWLPLKEAILFFFFFLPYITQLISFNLFSTFQLSRKVSVYLPSSFSCSPIFDNSYSILLHSLFFIIIHWRERRIKRRGKK